jgi:hypothetical protein
MRCVQEDLQWEQRAVVVDDNIEMPLTGMQIALGTLQQADGGHGRNNDNNMVGLVMAMRDQIRLALLTPNKQRRFGLSSTATATPSNNSSSPSISSIVAAAVVMVLRRH